MSRGKSHKMAVSSALRSARLPVNLIGSPISYASRLIGSPITAQSTGCKRRRSHWGGRDLTA